MHHKREVALRELPVAILEELPRVGRDSVSRHRHILKGALADHCALRVESRDGHLQRARPGHVGERICLVNHQVVADAFLALTALGDSFQRLRIEVGIFLNNLKNNSDLAQRMKYFSYICNVKTLKGHEAAAPNKAAYFVPDVAKETLWQPRGRVETPPKAHP